MLRPLCLLCFGHCVQVAVLQSLARFLKSPRAPWSNFSQKFEIGPFYLKRGARDPESARQYVIFILPLSCDVKWQFVLSTDQSQGIFTTKKLFVNFFGRAHGFGTVVRSNVFPNPVLTVVLNSEENLFSEWSASHLACPLCVPHTKIVRSCMCWRWMLDSADGMFVRHMLHLSGSSSRFSCE